MKVDVEAEIAHLDRLESLSATGGGLSDKDRAACYWAAMKLQHIRMQSYRVHVQKVNKELFK